MVPFFSVVIPALNEEVNLPILLEALSKQTFKDFEVIVSDGNSQDKTPEKALEFENSLPSLLFFTNNVKNVGAARNQGAEKARGEYLVFFDADVSCEEIFLESVKRVILKERLEAMTVWNRAKENSVPGKIILGLLNVSMTIFQKVKPTANGPCIIIKKDLFNKIGGFDDTIVFGEDFELIQRAFKERAKFAVFTKPILYVSTRRFDKEGFFRSLGKSLKAIVHQLFLGPIRKHIFAYEMGGQYYTKNKN